MSFSTKKTAEGIIRPSKIMKETVDVEIILHDGTSVDGSVFVGRSQRVQDLLNDSNAFFPIVQHNGEILLVAKSAIAICKPLDNPG